MKEITDFWKQLNFTNKPYIHKDDTAFMNENSCSAETYESYISSEDFWHNNKGRFNTNLFPIPFAGNLKSAKIFILLLNPGLNLSDYHAEHTSPDFIEELKNNIAQENLNSEYPFLFLNPKFLWHPGGQYWLKKLKDHILKIKDTQNKSYIDALSYVSQKTAILELVPYHSNNFTFSSLIGKLKSVQQMKAFVNGYLINKVKENECCIICTRKSKEWNLPEHKNIIVYKGTESRSAHLSKNSRAFNKIQEFLID